MADDRMKNDDLQRNMGGAGDKDSKNYGGGQQSPGRSGQGQGGGQQAGQHGGGQQGGQKGTQKMDDDEDFGSGSAGSKNRGGQNR